MNYLSRLTLSLALFSAASGLQATPADDPRLQLCAAELRDFSGAEAEVKMISQRRKPDGVSLRIAVRIDDDNARFGSCWVSDADLLAWRAASDGRLVADSARVVAGER